MSEQVLGFLGLMRRAGALAVGAEDAFDAARENKARVLLMAGDVAKNTISAMHNAAAQKEDALLEHPHILRQPIVRNGKKACVGYCPETYQRWVDEG